MPSQKRKTYELSRSTSKSPSVGREGKRQDPRHHRPKRSRHFHDCALCDKLRRELRRKNNSELKRSLEIDYWKRTEECSLRKREHMERVERKRDVSMEEWIFQTTLKGTNHAMEKNPFPYQTPANIEHWTLWATHEMERREIERFVYHFIRTEQPCVESWEYDENSHRSIDIFHVHVYLKFREGTTSDSKGSIKSPDVEYETPTRDELQGILSAPQPGSKRRILKAESKSNSVSHTKNFKEF